MDARRDLEETMSKGTVTLLVIVFVVCISCGAGYAAYRIVREKLRRLSRMAFGTDCLQCQHECIFHFILKLFDMKIRKIPLDLRQKNP